MRDAICDSICAYLDLFIDLLIVLFILEECLMKLKSKLLTAGLIATAVVPLAACGNGGSNQGGESTGEKTFVYGTTGYGKDMLDVGTNPHDGYTGWSTLRYGVGETLFKYDDSMQIQPWLAKSYEFIDNNHVKIQLRDDVTFSSGRKMDATAVKECLDDLIKVHDRASSDLKIANITTDGDYTIIIETSEPTPAIINFLSDPYGCIIDMSVPEKDMIVAGTGPYIATSVSDTEIDLVKNTNYWGGDVKVDKVVVKGIVDGTTLTNALQNGELDATYGLPYASYSIFENNADYNIDYVETSRQFFGKFNYHTAALQDQNVRKAISMGIDKDGFVKTLLNGHGATSKGPFPSSFKFGDDTVNTVSYDPEGAKALLEQSGWVDTDGDGIREKNGQKLSLVWLTYPGRQELPLLAESAQATLKDIGVDIQVNSTQDHKSLWKSGQYDIYVSAMVTAPTGDPEYFFNTHALTGASSNYEGYSNAKLDELAKTLHGTFDVNERAKIATEMSQIILDDNAYFFASHLKMGIVSKAGVSGIAPHPCDYYEITADLDKK